MTPENIEKKIYKYYFKQKDKSSDLGWNDLTCIIHIIDIDGAYINDSNIKEFSQEESELAKSLKCKNTLYFDDHIAVNPDKSSVELMKIRNHNKRRNVEYLVDLEKLTISKKSVQYYLYYFCSNLDHYLYGTLNMINQEKYREAKAFGNKYKDGKSLSDFMKNSQYSTTEDYQSSWNSLRKGNSSLARGTNLNLLIDKISKSSLEDWL